MRDAMTVITAIVLAICGLTYWAEARADYILQLVVGTGEDAEIVDVGRWPSHRQCMMVWNQYRLGQAVYGDELDRPIHTEQIDPCLSCEDYPEFCRRGI